MVGHEDATEVMMDEQKLGQSQRAATEQGDSEQLSAWIDNELTPEQGGRLARDILSTQPLRQQWDEWHLIGDVMRSAPLAQPNQLSQRIASSLASEPIHLPSATTRTTRRGVRQRQWAYGGAAVAAIAFVALVTLAPQMQEGSMTGFLAMGGSSPTAQSSQASLAKSTEPAMPVPVQDPRLRELMDAHGSMSIRPVSVEVR